MEFLQSLAAIFESAVLAALPPQAGRSIDLPGMGNLIKLPIPYNVWPDFERNFAGCRKLS